MTKCDNCQHEASIQRIKIVKNRFCSRKCLVEFADKSNPEWKDSEFHKMCVESEKEEPIVGGTNGD